MIQSTALEANLAAYQFDVTIDEKYLVIQEVMSKYYGIMDGVNTFLEELSHPHRNLPFIVKEARHYSLNYFHLLKDHPDGPEAASRFADIFLDVILTGADPETEADAADNFLLFLQKTAKESGEALARFTPVLDNAFHRIHSLDDSRFFLFVKSYYQINRIVPAVRKAYHDAGLAGTPERFDALNRILFRYLDRTYAYWLDREDPLDWFLSGAEVTGGQERFEPFFEEIRHDRIRRNKNRLLHIAAGGGDHPEPMTGETMLEELLTLPGYNQITETYREIPRKLLEAGREKGQGNYWKIIFLFHIMNIQGLSMVHEDALRDINRTLGWLIDNEKHLNIEKLIQKTFSILKDRFHQFPATALNCVLNMGKGVYKTDDSELVNFFTDQLLSLGFQHPMVGGVGNDWQIKVNSAHILNIRTWFELIELSPRWSTRLLSALIIHLTLGGVFIKDTDLFPRDITRLLNSRIEPVYNLIKQLMRLFPVYFNDIGAEGELRDISTEIDELSHRKDPLIHFLRKQAHVESSNRITGFMEAVIRFWLTRDKSHVEPYVPPAIQEEIREEGPYVDGVNALLIRLGNYGLSLPEDLLSLAEESLESLLYDLSAENTGVSGEDVERVKLAAGLYKLLHRKYDLVFFEPGPALDQYLSRIKSEGLPSFKNLRRALEEDDLKARLFGLLDYMEDLKRVILSSESFEVREDIYKKRHFTVDIPSMYGSYNETKFDALGMTFRLESTVNVLLEQLIDNIDLSLVTKATFFQIYDKLILFHKAMRVDGIASIEFERQMDLLAHSLEARGFTFTQYMDIFKGFAQAVKNIINDFFNNIHEENLTRILRQVDLDRIQPKYLPQRYAGEGAEPSRQELVHGASEIFFREKIALSLGLQQLDRFLSRILNTLFHQSYKLPANRLRLLLNYDPQRAMMSITEPKSNAAGMIYLGNKGFNLVKLRNFGLPVPPGFILTTEVFRCRSIIEDYPPALQNFREQVLERIRALETDSGKSFGDPANPLLLSVRSGSSISQPGMMDTFLDVGINEEIASGIAEATGNAWFAWDCYRRFLQCYGMAKGLKRDDFDSIIKTFKELWNIPYKKGFPGEMMRSVALAYKRSLEEADIRVEEDPMDQLLSTIRMVLNSWETPKAKTYRKIIGISDDWGTAVTVQSMVFGNRSHDSGTGVFFTHNPRWPGDDTIRLWGDFTLENQGEDVVSGLVNTMPISLSQQDIEMRDTDVTLETHFPEIYRTLKGWAEDLIYKKRWSPQEMEFTFESRSPGDLYLLQTRDMAIRERKKVIAFRHEAIGENLLGHGIGVSGGALGGRAVFTLEEIDKWRSMEPETPLILLRADTVPDDIREIHAADGILTARGGLTSHAAVVAHRLGKTCVVGCGSLVCKERDKVGIFDDVTINAGDYISIDGQEGSVYQGLIDIEEKQAG